MFRVRVFTFIGSNNNRIEITAPSKSQAMKLLKRSCQGMGVFRYESYRPETQDEFLARYGRQRQREAEVRMKQATAPRPVGRRKAFGRNDKCPCGSGKKVKRCCARRGSSPSG